jgi:hypothetical protein
MHFYPSKRKHSAVCKDRELDSNEIKSRQIQPEIEAKENQYHRELQKLKKSIPCWENFFTVSEKDRIDSWVRLEIIGNSLSEKFAWAVPDNRALKVLKHFSPLIEIGAGKGYFSKLLQDNGVDIISFDKIINEEVWTKVDVGGPKKLSKNVAKDRNLFLCYPDEDSAMASECLEHFDGEYIIHAGELCFTGQLSSPQAPWGRTTGADFQVQLMSEFHCILVAELPTFPFSRDCITVWKRTEWVRGRESIDKEYNEVEDNVSDEEEEQGEAEEQDDAWAAIPPSERLPVTRAAPDLQFLL